MDLLCKKISFTKIGISLLLKFTYLLLVIFYFSISHAQAPDTLWTKTYGGSSYDRCFSVQQTTDGGYIIFGETESFGAGDLDVWLIKTNVNGDVLWTHTYGGDSQEVSRSGQQTTDGGYIIAGSTKSFGPDTGVIHVYLIKTDSLGDSLWTKTYDAKSVAYSVQQTSDSGYIIAGSIYIGFDENIYLIKIDSSGDTLWTRSYGGVWDEDTWSARQTFDGGYIVAGSTRSFGVGSSYDVWFIKTDAYGDTIWTRTYGGPSWDYGLAVQQTTDSGYIIAGTTSSFGAGLGDVWFLKTDAYGDTIWTRTYGGSNSDWGRSVQQTHDGGYIIAGYTDSFGAGESDIYLIKTDSDGDTLWTTTYGGLSYDFSMSVQQTSDYGYIIAGYTDSFGAGYSDVWFLKMEPDTFGIMEHQTIEPSLFTSEVYPNPAKTFATIHTSRPAQRIEIYNILGQLIREETLKEGNETKKILLNHIGAGVYFLKINTQDTEFIRKLIVTR